MIKELSTVKTLSRSNLREIELCYTARVSFHVIINLGSKPSVHYHLLIYLKNLGQISARAMKDSLRKPRSEFLYVSGAEHPADG